MALASAHFGQADVLRRLRLAEQQQETNERYAQGATIGAAGVTIKDDGAIVVLNQNGTAVVRLGRLADGSYGAAAINSQGQEVPLSKLFFNDRSIRTETNLVVNGSNTDVRVLQRVGPTIDAYEVGEGGRLKIDVSVVLSRAVVPVAGQSTSMAFGVYIDGPSSKDPVIDNLWATAGFFASDGPNEAGTTVGTTGTFYVSGLAPGTYSVVLGMQTGTGRSFTCLSRELLVRSV